MYLIISWVAGSGEIQLPSMKTLEQPMREDSQEETEATHQLITACQSWEPSASERDPVLVKS